MLPPGGCFIFYSQGDKGYTNHSYSKVRKIGDPEVVENIVHSLKYFTLLTIFTYRYLYLSIVTLCYSILLFYISDRNILLLHYVYQTSVVTC